MRRFCAGQGGDLGGIHWRVVEGRKGPGDLRLEIFAPRFVPVPMSLAFLEADFYSDNERVLYPNGDREKFLKYVRGAVVLGWLSAVDQLNAEKERKRQRLEAR